MLQKKELYRSILYYRSEQLQTVYLRHRLRFSKDYVTATLPALSTDCVLLPPSRSIPSRRVTRPKMIEDTVKGFSTSIFWKVKCRRFGN